MGGETWQESRRDVNGRIDRAERACESLEGKVAEAVSSWIESEKRILASLADQRVEMAAALGRIETRAVASELAMRELIESRFREQDSKISALAMTNAILGVQISPRATMIAAIIALLGTVAGILAHIYG